MHMGLSFSQHRSGNLTFELFISEGYHCKGNITIQDYIPRNFSFSLGFFCDRIGSLRGILYQIKIDVSNDTDCFKLPVTDICYRHMHFGVIPYLLGDVKMFTDKKLLRYASSCYQHAKELLCYVLTTKCDPETKQMIPPCREICYDYLNICGAHLGNGKYINCDYLPNLNGEIPCFYEPLWCRGPPTIENTKVILTDFTIKRKYLLPDTAEYSCNEGFKMEGNQTITCLYKRHWSMPPKCSLKHSFLSTPNSFLENIIKTEPTSTSKPEFTDESTVPHTPISIIHFLVVLLLLILLVILFVTVAVRYKIKLNRAKKLGLKRQEVLLDIELKEKDISLPQEAREDPKMSLDPVTPLKRNRTVNATIFYHFDTDDEFVLNHLLPELEETRKFKLCIQSRNFIPGRDIKDNIDEAIEGSNSAIIVMSQGFVDSMWCKEEFTHCYIENMKDESFNLFVIIMQPTDTLFNISNYMKLSLLIKPIKM